jgi:hypothetical protein
MYNGLAKCRKSLINKLMMFRYYSFHHKKTTRIILRMKKDFGLREKKGGVQTRSDCRLVAGADGSFPTCLFSESIRDFAG